MKAPGELASITYDSTARLRVGDYLRTTTGRTYLIQSIRLQQRGKWAGRQHLKCVVMAPGHVVEDDAFVFPIAWYSRNKTRR